MIAAVTNKLFIQNLPFSLSELDLRDAFAQHGTVTDMLVPVERDTGRPRGFAYITMGTEAEATAVIAKLHDREFHGRVISVTPSVSKQQLVESRRPRGR